EMHRLSLSSQGIIKMLDIVQESTQAQIIFIPLKGQSLFSPRLLISEQQRIMQTIELYREHWESLHSDSNYVWTESKRNYIIQPVEAMNQALGFIVLVNNHRSSEEFDFLILDRLTISVAQDLLRRNYMEEKKLHSEQIWVDDLIHHRLKSEEQVKNLIGNHSADLFKLKYRLFIIEFVYQHDAYQQLTLEEELESSRMHFALFGRNLFQQNQFHPLITTTSNQLIVIAIDIGDPTTNKARLLKIATCIQTLIKENIEHMLDSKIAIGRSYKNLLDAYKSYHEAQSVLRAQQLDANTEHLFYDDLGIARMLFMLDHERDTFSFINDYLGPILQYDEDRKADLLLTLKTYLNCNCSKQLTAETLFIVRQTLYHRLDKIKQLLGEDFISPEKRISIEVAIRAYELLTDQYKHELSL
ncbi:MAG: helix-turn-helix domain-containing protein, partial [Bacilli bacterium]